MFSLIEFLKIPISMLSAWPINMSSAFLIDLMEN